MTTNMGMTATERQNLAAKVAVIRELSMEKDMVSLVKAMDTHADTDTAMEETFTTATQKDTAIATAIA